MTRPVGYLSIITPDSIQLILNVSELYINGKRAVSEWVVFLGYSGLSGMTPGCAQELYVGCRLNQDPQVTRQTL